MTAAVLFDAIFLAVCACAILPAALFCVNLRRFREPPPPGLPEPSVAVLIPARNEEANITAALEAVRASTGAALEILVLDDHSTDRTAALVLEQAGLDPRVRLVESPALPAGWNGKQHACWTLAHAAAAPLLLFLDADVRLEPAAIARMAAFARRSANGTPAALVSGFPRLVTVGFLERLLLPLIHFILLAYLPMGTMRRSNSPGFSAGCGQFLLCDRQAYFASGGHAAIRDSMHDGLLLPRAFRRAGHHTDIADITRLAHIRMYDTPRKVWLGLAKNATEGIATPAKIVPLSLILLLGQVGPLYPLCVALLLLAYERFSGVGVATATGYVSSSRDLLLCVAGVVAIALWLPRLLAARRFRQPLDSALLHPLGILVLLAIQWYALARKLANRPVGWRDRTYTVSPTTNH
jgi:glycosyltransferase involved in cell wall biosynthesis